LRKGSEGFCRIILGIKDIHNDIMEVEYALYYINTHRNKSIKAILNSIFTMEESLQDICEGVEHLQFNSIDK